MESLAALVEQEAAGRLVLLLREGPFDLRRFHPYLLRRLVEDLHGPGQQLLPLEPVEEEVLLEFLVAAALAVLRAAAEQLLDEGLAALGAVARVLDAGVDDFLVDGEGVLGGLAEGQLAAEQLVGDDSQRPEVHVEAVALAGDDLGRHVVRGADDGVGAEPALDLELLGGAHVDEREEAVDVHHEVFGLEVAVDDAVGVQVLHHQQDLRHQLPRVLRREGDHLRDDVEEVLALDELHDEVDEVGVLDQLVEAHHEGELRHRPQDLLLVHYVLDDLRFLNVVAVQHLNRVQLFRLVVPAGVDLAEVALTQLPHHLEVRYLHLLLEGRAVLAAGVLPVAHPHGHRRGRHLQLVEQLAEHAVVGGHHVLLDLQALLVQQLAGLDYRVGLEGEGGAPEVGVEQHVDATAVLAALLEDRLALPERHELAGVGCVLELLPVERLVELRLADDLPHDVALHDVLEAVAETSFDVLAAHGDDNAAGLGNERVGADAALNQDGVLPEAVHLPEFVGLLLDEHGALLDDVEGVGVVALVEDDLSLLVGLGEAGGGERVLLVLVELLEEGEHLQELLVLLLVLLVDVVHHLLEDPPVYLRQLAVGQRQHRGRPWRVVDDAEVPEGVAVVEGALLLAVDLYLADALEDDVVGAALVALLEDVVVARGRAGLHLLDEALDLLLVQLREDEVLLERLLDLAHVGSADGRLLVVLHVVLHLDVVVAHDERVLAPPLLQSLLLHPTSSTSDDREGRATCAYVGCYSRISLPPSSARFLAALHWQFPIFYFLYYTKENGEQSHTRPTRCRVSNLRRSGGGDWLGERGRFGWWERMVARLL